MYKSIWRYASVEELLNIVLSSIVSNLAILSYTYLIGSNLPRGVYIIATLLDMMFIGGVRFCCRTVRLLMDKFSERSNKKRIMIIGAGEAGALVIKEYKNHRQLNSKPVAVIDDDEYKHRKVIMGVPIVGGRDDILTQAEKLNIDEIILAIPSASKKDISHIVEICKESKAKLKILPGVYELIDGKVTIKNIRDVQIEDLLGRYEVKTDIKEISSYIKDKVVVVTGGGGSIGSELCRQISNIKPKKLIIIDIYENSAYDIQNELLRHKKDLKLKVYIASIIDRDRIFELFNKEKPDVVFHAAAHKHVPLMEDSPKESIKNNVFGTLNLVQAADKFGIEKFVMISTDKAVNPTNIMGANVDSFEKEFAEKIGAKHAAALITGTAAIHMALKAAGVDKGDIVLCQDLTFSATANSILYQNAIPVFVDSDYDTWNISPKALEEAFQKYPNAKAVLVVHLYGLSADMDRIVEICKGHQAVLIEDAAEALGTYYKDRHVGTFGDYGAFSFNGNKIITTSGGGMLVSDNEERIAKVRFWATQSREKARHYQHNEIGYNYRMSNILAGIGRGQLKVLDKRVGKKKYIFEFYKRELGNLEGVRFMPINEWNEPNYWLSCMILSGKVRPLDIIEALEKENIESRHLWKPMHMQPFFERYDYIGGNVSENLFGNGVCLPSDTKMTDEDLRKVCWVIKGLWL